MNKEKFIDLYISLKKDQDTNLITLIDKYLPEFMEDENVNHTFISMILKEIARKTKTSKNHILAEIGALGFFGKLKNRYYISKNFMEFLMQNNIPFTELILNQNVNKNFVIENQHKLLNTDIVYIIKKDPTYMYDFENRIINRFDDSNMSLLIKNTKVPLHILKQWMIKNKQRIKLETINTLVEKFSANFVLENFIDELNEYEKNYIIKNFDVDKEIIKQFLDQLNYEYVLNYAEIDDDIVNTYTKKYGIRKIKPLLKYNKKYNYTQK